MLVRFDNEGPITFPIGFALDDPTVVDAQGRVANTVTLYDRPAQVKVKDYSADGYITIRPVSGELKTVETPGTGATENEVLDQYWRVTHDFPTGDEPTVAMRFYFYNQDGVAGVDLASGATGLANYVPGYVRSSDFQRGYESDPDITDATAGTPQDVTDVTNPIASDTDVYTITFNGTNDNSEFTQTGFTGFELFEGDFTAGVPAAFVGSPKILYARETSAQSWTNVGKWTLNADGSDDGTNAGFPQAGDVAVLNRYNDNDE